MITKYSGKRGITTASPPRETEKFKDFEVTYLMCEHSGSLVIIILVTIVAKSNKGRAIMGACYPVTILDPELT